MSPPDLVVIPGGTRGRFSRRIEARARPAEGAGSGVTPRDASSALSAESTCPRAAIATRRQSKIPSVRLTGMLWRPFGSNGEAGGAGAAAPYRENGFLATGAAAGRAAARQTAAHVAQTTNGSGLAA